MIAGLPQNSETAYNKTILYDLEFTVKFIIKHQAQFAADIEALKDRQAENSRQIEANTAQIGAHTTQIGTHTGMIRQLTDVSLSLAHHMERLAEVQANTERKLNALVETQGKTEYKLNALIDTVDKLVRRDGGGM